jgi:hypothetical protein
MVPPISVGSDVEVRGTTVCLVVEGLSDLSDEAARQANEILVDAEMADPEPDSWYSLRDWIDVLDEIGATVGDDALRELGVKVPKGVEWPPDVNTTRQGFDTVNEAYQLNHRGGEIGSYEFVETGDRERTVICENPYPCPFDKGLLEGVLRVFGEEFNYSPMVLIHETGDECRADGGDRCTYRVTW